jgi:hypothetical protein
MTLCRPAITGESNKLIGLATEAEVRWVHDITDQDYDLLLEVTTHEVYGFPIITLVNIEATLKLYSPTIADLCTLHLEV